MELRKEVSLTEEITNLIKNPITYHSENAQHGVEKSKTLRLGYKYSKSLVRSMDYLHAGKLSEIGKVSRTEEDISFLNEAFDKVSPLLYLTGEQRKNLRKKVFFLKVSQKTILYSGSNTKPESGDYAAFILLTGEIHFFDNELNFQDMVNSVCFFGYDGPIFNKRQSTVVAEPHSYLAVFLPEVFLDNLIPFSKFSTFISRNIIYKEDRKSVV